MSDAIDLDDLLRALSHHSRRAILRLCIANDMPAMNLAEHLGIAPATASEHLKVLRKSGLVEMTAAGTQRLYRTSQTQLHAVITAIAADLEERT